MPELHPAVEHRPLPGGEVELYAGHTGRAVVLHADTLAALDRSPPLRQRLERLGMWADQDLSSFVPCPHHATLLLPDVPALWVPVPERHGPGGHAYRALPLTDDDRALWRDLDGRRRVGDLAARRGLSIPQLLRRLAPWTARDTQALQLREVAPRPHDEGLRRLVGPTRTAHDRSPDQRGPRGETTLGAYHGEAIVDGTTHFDDRETTVAHALAPPHPGLGMVPYGLALRRALACDAPVVEVGCGTGELAAAWLSGGPVPYLRIDLSPELLRTQALAAPSTDGVLGDAVRLPLRDASVPFLLSNEVLADLQAVPGEADHAEVSVRRARYRLPPRRWSNLGAWMFVEEIARVLAPGGRAVLTEFGSPHDDPEEAVQLDHPEVSICFGDLVTVAKGLGLHAELVRLDDLLEVDLNAPQLSRTSWRALRAAAAWHGAHLSARAWTPATLSLPFPVEGLRFTTLADEGPGPLITRFYALILRR